MLKISIAMTTFNGEKYLQEQLDSFLKQTIKPNELIVIDDCSSDKTVDILNSFKQKAPFKVKIIKNETNIGSTTKYGYSKNFEKALYECQGDIVFFSDQDDVWFPEKIEKHLNIYESNPNIVMIANDAIRTYENLSHHNITQSQFCNIVCIDSSKKNTDKTISGIGCCYSLRLSTMKQLLPIPINIPHDNWIRKCIYVIGNYYSIKEPLQYFRRLSSSWSSKNEFGDGVSLLECYLTKYRRIYNYFLNISKYKTNLKTEIQIETQLIKTIVNFNNLSEKEFKIQQIHRKIKSLKERLKVAQIKPNMKRLKNVLNLIKNDNYSLALAIKDWLIE